MTRSIGNCLFGLMIAGLTACGSSLPGNGAGKGGQTTTGGGGATGGGSIVGVAGAGGTGGAVGPGGTGGSGPFGNPMSCIPGVPATTQLRRMQNRQYDAVVRDLLGVTTVDLGAGAKPPSAQLFPDSDGPMTADAWRLYRDVGKAIAKTVMASPALKLIFLGCDPAASGCLTDTIKSFGRKAFRRPLTTAEVQRFAALGEPPSIGTPDDVAEATLYAFLVSPPFLMIPELNTIAGPSPQTYQLTSHEVAARLSFMLWGSVGDDLLNTAADNNQLQTREQILAQAQRMIAVRAKTAPQVSALHRRWARMDDPGSHWWSTDHDVVKYPLYSAAARTSYAAELDSFFEEIAYTNGSYKDLLLSNVGFVNKDNAAIYGLTSSSTALTKVDLDPTQRPGFLTRVGFLSSFSQYDVTSPIRRGAFITKYLTGVDPGPPVSGDAMIRPPPGSYGTNRQVNEALVAQSSACMGCHTNIINPPGYVLENYDAIGQWQTMDHNLFGPIDATATVNFGEGVPKEIHNALELMQELARTKKGQVMYAQSMVAYGYGRDANNQDQCVVDAISGKLAQDGYTILDALVELTKADSFRLRVRGL